ncbi:DUF4176 domain-containing protein [Bacillus cereus]|jgi:hypothetical protein|uniref:DUF4176 domain-containing protein n=1 Tax=Bacillus nitratireducens TaxID=2026193 RepID=A0ABU6PKJ5_9BACI|nr:DUF4176 domain-containing protein [Bacillus nitratireducens]EOP60623.1 hypothetical protein IKQ_05875 [Bacillus cereus VDM053]PDY20870.1 DUF4176 domain-containing protein [Bacillus cereus]MDR4173555.1 DUF4176 domain-containing protein [Bacillus nitratireducens]MED4680879.1 DUF4176 domain-containing protein [Bacillus nitratireducens]PFJ90924.1 DUF4176 domain-containing protein [Bacillus cereus]
MVEYNKRELLEVVLQNDKTLDLEITDELLQMGNLLGNQPSLFREVYKAFRNQEDVFENKPKIGAKFSVTFDYPNEAIHFERLETQLDIPFSQFLRLMGLIDACYSEILPLGTVVELDVDMMPEVIQNMFKNSELGELVILTGRKVPLREGFNDYVVDYLGYLWPFGEMSNTPAIYVSNMMIKRVVSPGMTNEWEDQFAFTFLRSMQVANGKLSSAFLPLDKALDFYEAVHTSPEREAD